MKKNKINILITRPNADAIKTAKKLNSIGLDNFIVPMMNISTNFDILDEMEILSKNADIQGVFITSSNAIKSLISINFPKYITLFCIGKYTSQFAQKNGFEHVYNTGNNVDDLISYAKNNIIPTNGLIIYASGDDISKDLKLELEPFGYNIKRIVVYKSYPLNFIPPILMESLQNNLITHILFYSKRTASIFKGLILNNNLDQYLHNITAITLSENIRLEIENLSWHNMYSSNMPNEEALFAILTQTIEV